MNNAEHDHRYDYSICRECGQRWQNIDFGANPHAWLCDGPSKGTDAMIPEQERTKS